MPHTSIVFRIKSAALLVLLTFCHGFSAVVISYPGSLNQFPPETMVNETSIGGKTTDEALEQLMNEVPDYLSVILIDEKENVLEEMALSLEEINARYPMEDLARQLESLIRGRGINRLVEHVALSASGKHISTDLEYDQSALESWAIRQEHRMNRPASDARVTVEKGVVRQRSEVYGQQVAAEDVVAAVSEALKKGVFGEVQVTGNRVPPEVTLDELGDFRQKLGEYDTYLGDNPNRRENIRLAGAQMNGQRIPPGGTFSFNETVGQVSIEDGYLPAPVIQNGRLVQGLGGGICQASSTLYQAVLRTGFAIAERANHSLPVGYLPLGMDAAIAYGEIDFRFVNVYEYPVLIGAWLDKDLFRVAIFGPEDVRLPHIEIETRNHQIIPAPMVLVEDPELEKGAEVVRQMGQNGHRIAVYRLTGRTENEYREELISTDYYRPVDRIIRIGTGEALVEHK